MPLKRLLLLFFVWIVVLPATLLYAQPGFSQDSVKAKPKSITKSKKIQDSALRARVKRWKASDSLRRTMRRDSMRAGMAIHLHGRMFRINTPEGRHVHDSLTNPARFKKLAKLRRDSVLALNGLQKPVFPNQTVSAVHDSLSKTIKRKDSTRRTDTLAKASRQTPLPKPLQTYPLPLFIKNPRLRSRAEASYLRTQAYIARTFSPEQARSILLAIPITAALKPAPVKGRPHVREGAYRAVRPIWVVFVLLAVLVLVALVKTLYPRDLQEVFESLFNDRLIRSNRDAGALFSISFILMFMGFCLVAGMLIYDYLVYLRLDLYYSGLRLYSVICLSVLAFFAIKLFFYRLSAGIFNIDRFLKPYMAFLYVTLANFTIAALPFLVFYSFFKASFLPQLVVWIPFIFVFFFLFLYLRSLVYTISNFQFQKFYLFLYFCTFEICPLIIVFKVING